MSKTLAVIDRLEYTGRGRLARDLYLGLGLPVKVCLLGDAAGPWAEQLRQAGVEVESLGGRGGVDPRAWKRLRSILASFAPRLVHAWGSSAARLVSLCGWRGPALVSPALVGKPRLTMLDRLDRMILGRFDRVLLTSQAERRAALALGLPAEKLEVVVPGHAPAEPLPPAEDLAILTVGDLVPERGQRYAVWALDILRHVRPEARLVVVGAGPERGRLEEFARSLSSPLGVEFAGEQADLRPWLARAQVVWCPGLRDVGHDFALTALAHGRPVIAARHPGMAERIDDGRTGLLVPSGEQVELAKATRLLLDDPARMAALADAGRQVVSQRYSLTVFREAMRRLYEARS